MFLEILALSLGFFIFSLFLVMGSRSDCSTSESSAARSSGPGAPPAASLLVASVVI